MTIRSGRFKSGRVIISGRSDTWFRLLNSAEFDNSNVNANAITVTFGTGNGNSAIVLPTFSLDFFARGDVSVAGINVVEGIYESLPNADFKSGRFKTRQPIDPTAGVQIITSGAGNTSAIYRIFNSGSTPLQLVSRNHNGSGEANIGGSIAPDESLDFVTPPNKIVLVKGTVADVHIDGIYDFLGEI